MMWTRVRRSRLLTASGVYVLSNIANRGVPFLLLPLLTRYLTPADFGRVAMFTLAITLATPFIGFSTENAATRQFYERDTIDFPQYLGTCFYVLAVTTGVAIVATSLFHQWIAEALVLPIWCVAAVIAVAVGRYVTSVVLNLYQVQGRPLYYGIFFLLQTIVSLGVSVYLVVHTGMGWWGRVIGELVGVGLMASVGFVMLVRGHWLRWGGSKAAWRHAVKFGGGLVPHAYGGVMIIATDRFLLTHMVGVSQTGIYMVAAQVAAGISVLEASFNLAWTPWLFERLKTNDPSVYREILRFRRLYNVGILGLALVLGLVAPWFLGFFVGAAFAGAGAFVFWLALGNAFSGMYKMVVNPIFYANKTHILAWVTFITGTINVALCYGFIRWHGALGAAEATAVALFLSYAATAVLSEKVYPLRAR